jgi:hypothetical protein
MAFGCEQKVDRFPRGIDCVPKVREIFLKQKLASNALLGIKAKIREIILDIVKRL